VGRRVITRGGDRRPALGPRSTQRYAGIVLRFVAVVIACAAVGCRGDRDGQRLDLTLPLMPIATPSHAATAVEHPAGPIEAASLLGSCAAAGTATSDDPLLDEAERHLEAGQWADAFTCADIAADRSPQSIEPHHLRAAALAGAGHDREAATAYDLALALDPDDPETLRAAADFYVNVVADKTQDTTALGLELARRGSARAAARRRGQADLRGELALLEAQAENDRGHSREALERAAAAIAFDRELVDAVHEHGVALFNLGRFREASDEFARVLAVRPDEPYAHHMLGLALEQLGRRVDAELHLTRAQAIAPDEFPAPLVMTTIDMQAAIADAMAALPPAAQRKAALVPITVVDLPDRADLVSNDPPFPPTILGLFRGLPLGVSPDPGEVPPPRAIVLYRLNLLRAVRTPAELTEQIDKTLRHELGHLDGLDEDDLRRRDLE
jgi:Flp pilus assembly protein TadD